MGRRRALLRLVASGPLPRPPSQASDSAWDQLLEDLRLLRDGRPSAFDVLVFNAHHFAERLRGRQALLERHDYLRQRRKVMAACRPDDDKG